MNDSQFLWSQWWDFTVAQRDITSYEALKEWMKTKCERGAVNLETGESGYLHYQGRIVFTTHTPINYLRTVMPTAHWTPTQVRDFDYIFKDKGVWTTWDEALEKYRTLNLMPWQTEAYGYWGEQSHREILVITDPRGNSGKTWFGNFLVANREAVKIPPIQDGRNLMGTVLQAGGPGGYVIDVPRTGRLSDGFWEAIEQVKNGFLYETRYSFSWKWIEPPKILVTTNYELTKADLKGLSIDRWRIMRI